MPLPGELYNLCRAILLQCNEFDNNAALRGVFVTAELEPFRSSVPDADSRAGRVDACLSYLLGKRLSDGRPALPFFLIQLRDRYPAADALWRELDAMAGQVQAALTPTVAPALSVPPPAAALGDDIFARYKAGVRELLRRLGLGHPRYGEALVYQQRLLENISQLQYGDNDTLRSARAEILGRLNVLAQVALGMSFNALCGIE